ncbi:hypothetical protein PM082_010600 [Marasmius tenuissimus]|nr:hypothetical protein PM082_010600 [Marasmius tenuissimus]
MLVVVLDPPGPLDAFVHVSEVLRCAATSSSPHHQRCPRVMRGRRSPRSVAMLTSGTTEAFRLTNVGKIRISRLVLGGGFAHADIVGHTTLRASSE